MSKKKVIYAVLLIPIFLILSIVVFLFMIDSIAKSGVEKGATYALDVRTTLKDMRVSLLGGEIMMDGLDISNPAGFASSHLMQTGKFDVKVEPRSLFSDTIRVRKFVLNGLDVNVDQTLKGNNISKILDNIKRLSSGKTQEEPSESQEGKKIFVKTITIQNVVAHFNLDAKLAAKNLTVKIPTIVLKDVSSEDSPVVVRQLVVRVIPAILLEVIKNSKGIVPSGLLRSLSGQLISVQSLVNVAQKQTEDAVKGLIGSGQKAITGATDAAKAKALDATKKQAENAVKNTIKEGTKNIKGLGGLLNSGTKK